MAAKTNKQNGRWCRTYQACACATAATHVTQRGKQLVSRARHHAKRALLGVCLGLLSFQIGLELGLGLARRRRFPIEQLRLSSHEVLGSDIGEKGLQNNEPRLRAG